VSTNRDQYIRQQTARYGTMDTNLPRVGSKSFRSYCRHACMGIRLASGCSKLSRKHKMSSRLNNSDRNDAYVRLVHVRIMKIHIGDNKKRSYRQQIARQLRTQSNNSTEMTFKGQSRSLKWHHLIDYIRPPRNYGPILYHFRDKARYWSKIAIFSYPTFIL